MAKQKALNQTNQNQVNGSNQICERKTPKEFPPQRERGLDMLL